VYIDINSSSAFGFSLACQITEKMLNHFSRTSENALIALRKEPTTFVSLDFLELKNII
jgi:hypothetical protein